MVAEGITPPGEPAKSGALRQFVRLVGALRVSRRVGSRYSGFIDRRLARMLKILIHKSLTMLRRDDAKLERVYAHTFEKATKSPQSQTDAIQ